MKRSHPFQWFLSALVLFSIFLLPGIAFSGKFNLAGTEFNEKFNKFDFDSINLEMYKIGAGVFIDQSTGVLNTFIPSDAKQQDYNCAAIRPRFFVKPTSLFYISTDYSLLTWPYLNGALVGLGVSIYKNNKATRWYSITRTTDAYGGNVYQIYGRGKTTTFTTECSTGRFSIERKYRARDRKVVIQIWLIDSENPLGKKVYSVVADDLDMGKANWTMQTGYHTNNFYGPVRATFDNLFVRSEVGFKFPRSK